jgi:hypothetical protein
VELPKLTEKKQKSSNESRKEGRNPLFFLLFLKKVQKSSKKGLTYCVDLCIMSLSPRDRGTNKHEALEENKKSSKKFQKTLDKVKSLW